MTFRKSVLRVRSLGLLAGSKACIAKSLHSVGLYGAESRGISASHMRDVRISARMQRLVKEPVLGDLPFGAHGLWRTSRRSARGLDALSDAASWIGPWTTGHLRLLADRLGWVPMPEVGKVRSSTSLGTKLTKKSSAKWDSAKNLLAEVAEHRPDFKGLETGLSTLTYRHL
eukprot:4257721-Amphidinium_carterae.1